MIFYFSGTGNTRWAANKVAAALDDSVVDMAEEMRRVGCGDTAISYSLVDNERIGFFFPVHGWRPPRLVREFVGRLRINGASGHYCYVVCTAGDTVGEAEGIFEKDLLAATGISVDSAVSLIMPESYVGLPFMDVDCIEKEKRKKELSGFIKDVERCKKGIRDITVGNWPRINSRVIGAVFAGKLITDRPFHVDTDKCIGCGKCAVVCPVEDIMFDDSRKPVWRHNGRCLTCFSCYHHCPVKAIQFGRRTKGKGQYFYEKLKSRKSE